MKCVIYSGSSCVTAKAIAGGVEARRRKAPRPSDDILITWGGKRYVVGDGKKVLNNPEAVELCRDKVKSSLAFVHQSVPTPKIVTDTSKAASLLGFPLVARKATHQGGSGFWLCQSPAQLARALQLGASVAYEFVPDSEEYRVHVFRGRVIRCAKKKKKDDSANPIVKSHNRGWRLSGVYVSKTPTKVKSAAIKAVKALGLDFGAVDVAITNDDHRVFVFEVNSAPGLEGESLRRYIENIREWIAEGENHG